MSRRAPGRPQTELLGDRDAQRLLARASELDAAGTGATVTELRAAAVEAGISGRAFDAALAEMQGEAGSRDVTSAGPARWHRRLGTVAISGAVLLAVAALTIIPRAVAPSVRQVDAGGMIEETFVLRCLSEGEVAALVRPLLDLRKSTVVYAPAPAPRVLTIRATPEQLRKIRPLLERHDASGAPACASSTASGVRQ